MSARTRKPGTPKIAFLLNEQRFRQLVTLVQELTESENLEYRVGLSDGTSITCDSADEVLNIQNSRERQITSIWMETPYRSEPRIEVKFQSRTIFLEPIEYEVAGNEKDVFHASGKLDEYFSGLRQWYSPVVRLGTNLYAFYVVIIWVPLLLLYLWLIISTRGFGVVNNGVANTENGETEIVLTTLLTLFLLSSLSLVPICTFLLERLRRWLLPHGTFAIGDGVDRHNNIVHARRVVGGVIGTLVLGAVGFWLYPLLF